MSCSAEMKRDDAPHYNLKVVSSWNVWGIPFGSNKIFHKIKKWRAFNDRQLLQFMTASADTKSTDLVVSCFQECWSFRRGPFTNTFARSAESNWAKWKESAVLIAGIVCYPFTVPFSVLHDVGARMLDQRGHTERVPFQSVSGSNGMSLRRTKLIDSGLVILSTWKPKDHGFFRYVASKGMWTEENLANKGLLWSYFVDWNEPTKCGTLVFNTHLSTSHPVQLLQIQEIKRHFERIRDAVMDQTEHFEFYLMGDFNAETDGRVIEELQESMGLKRVSTTKPTNAEQTNAIDHIFVWRKNVNESESDIKYVQSEVVKPWESGHNVCPMNVDSLSDHCWQAVAVT